MRSFRSTALCLTLLAGLGGCGDTKASDMVASSKEALANLDLSKLSADEMKATASDLAAKLETKFQEIKDEASAIDVRKATEPLVDGLNKLKTALGDQMPSMAEVQSALDSIEAKFKGNETVMKVLQPLLDKIRQLLH